MSHPTNKLTLDNQAAIYLTPCPGTKSLSLEQTIEQFAEQGINAVVTLITEEELNRFSVESLPEVCKANGIEWFYAPIEDDHAPEQMFTDGWAKSKDRLHEILENKGALALHCKGGQGRTGTIAAQLLMERGANFEQAKAAVKEVKPGALTIEKQTDYLKALETKI